MLASELGKRPFDDFPKSAEAVWKHACGHGAGGSVCAGECHRWTVEQQRAQSAMESAWLAAIDGWMAADRPKRGSKFQFCKAELEDWQTICLHR